MNAIYLECEAVQFGESSVSIFGVVHLDEGSKFLCSVGNYVLNYTASYARSR